MVEGAYLYILRCADGSLYVGTTRVALEFRIAQHNDGVLGGHTQSRRPVVLVYAEWFERVTDAVANERKLKIWTWAKKEAFIRGDLGVLKSLARRRLPHPSRRAHYGDAIASPLRAPQDKD